ncbi:hypothetical protein CKM354_000115500 [Cercospora kikuchii]|uniref:F-box domain-containing protein n=1 Tax=Cercospora kikuchii TaxID=84275 RepID=A0A9P3C7H7_9PEZI|nr:uncharacterized protein CKM354_000115500 [Cercospora kikuchii]GIZ37718.1 hypothetical protein CKM354_000115500 [Cercospora kikuchii]
MESAKKLPMTLVDVLSNAVVLRQVTPHIPARELLRLAVTCKAIREILYNHSEAWRYLDITGVKRAIINTSPIDIGGVSWRSERMDESLTEDEFYAGPLRGILGRLHSKRILKYVQTLILDGLTVPADLVREIVAEDRYHVRVLSLRESKQLNITKLQQVLRYIVRPTRPDDTPRLKALYFFGQRDVLIPPAATKQPPKPDPPALGVMSSAGAQIGADWNQRSQHDLIPKIFDDESRWYGCNGRVMKRPYSEWAETLQVCRELISFDAVLCRGPRHDITKVASKDFLQPTIATIALGPEGCQDCHSSPEGPAVFGECAHDALPLLAPIPLHSSTVRGCIRPEPQEDGKFPQLILRCEDCLRGRWCEQCNRWWCENCYQEPPSRVSLRTEMQHLEMQEDLEREGWAAVNNAPNGNQVKVFSKLCVERCLVGEMMAGAGSNGMWG